MSDARGWTPSLRYSPVNGVIVNWGVGSETFSMACMPKPVCPGPDPVPKEDPCPCGEGEIIEPVDTYDWYRWVPETIAGLQDASEDMAASYARRAAIEFARKSRVLRRQITLTLQPGVTRYPLQPFEEESVQGVSKIESQLGRCGCEGGQGPVNIGEVRVDIARQELVIAPSHGCCGHHVNGRGPQHLLLTVWAAPTEDACKHDVYLYEQYRREITFGARADLLVEVHASGSYKTSRGYANYRGDQMMMARGDNLRAEFIRAMRKARVEAEVGEALELNPPPSPFAAGCCAPSRRR